MRLCIGKIGLKAIVVGDYLAGATVRKSAKLATATRKRVFGMVADKREPFIGYHMPFPGIGFAEKQEQGKKGIFTGIGLGCGIDLYDANDC